MDQFDIFNREFELLYLKSHGNAFQNLFSEIMELAYPGDFERVRPHGKSGDYKCDGYLTSNRTVFQVYAPERFVLNRLLKKIHDDFSGAKKHWTDRMERWVFVHNNQTGLPPQAIQVFDDLRKQTDAPVIEIWGYVKLREVLHQLDSRALQSIFPSELTTKSSTSLFRMLPHPCEVEKYWDWMVINCRNPSIPTHLERLQNLHLPIRLLTPQQARERSLIDQRMVIKVSEDKTSWTHFLDDGSMSKKSVMKSTSLLDLLRSDHNLLIVGDSGSGKSTLLRRFARRESRRLKKLTMKRASGRTPILVELCYFSPDRPLFELIAASVKRTNANISLGEVLYAFERGYVVLLIDGLDEVPPNYRQECISQILVISEKYPHARIVLTSRPFPEPIHQFHEFVIAPLSDADISGAIRTSLWAGARLEKHLSGLSPKEFVVQKMRPEVRQLCRRPLTLGLMITLLDNEQNLPETLYGVYDRFLSVLLNWEVRKGRLPSEGGATAALEETAYCMVRTGLVSIPTTDWMTTAGKAIQALHALKIASGPSAEEILAVALSTGLLINSGGEVSLSHKTFLDFLAARRIAGRPKSIHTDPVVLNMGVARFLVGKMQNVTALLNRYFDNCDDVEELMPLLKEASSAGCKGGRFELHP